MVRNVNCGAFKFENLNISKILLLIHIYAQIFGALNFRKYDEFQVKKICWERKPNIFIKG